MQEDQIDIDWIKHSCCLCDWYTRDGSCDCPDECDAPENNGFTLNRHLRTYSDLTRVTKRIEEDDANNEARPSREEDLRECLEWALTYVPLDLTKNEQAMSDKARAALAQGGAWDEAQGEAHHG